MPVYELGGVPVEFPYEAYECQLAYMRSVVEALDRGQNALLESPTGTGKTLCLLCACLGWRRHHQKQVTAARTSWEAQAGPDTPSLANSCPRIWYSSRTHSQLKQVVHELKRTSYKAQSVVLGSRQHFCIHTTVSRHTGPKQNAMCQRQRGDNKCPPYNGLRKQGSKVSVSRMDIEEIVATCKEACVCPFYKTREEAKDAELLLIPYDYLIGRETRESLQVPLRNSILVFDEGHNIERSCEEAASFDLRSTDITRAIEEVGVATQLAEDDPGRCEELIKDFTAEQFGGLLNMLKTSLYALEDNIADQRLEKDPTTDRTLIKKPGSFILHLLGKGSDRAPTGGIVEKDLRRISATIRKAILLLSSDNAFNGNSGGVFLDKLQTLLHVAFRQQEAKQIDQNYQVLIYEEAQDVKRGSKRKAVDFFSSSTPAGGGKDSAERVLCFWCFSCSVTLQEIMRQEVRSIIITSGTLSPMDSTAESFGIPFPVRLENSHVIDTKKQLWGGVLSTGPDGVSFDASFSQRSDPAYLKDLGKTVAAVAASSPDGLLLAFQSYSQKDTILQTWRNTGVLEEIQRHKPLLDEPKGNAELQQTMEKFNAVLSQTPAPGGVGGAILAAVCRGKLCEGIDFTDRQCRMVMLVGIPYPARNDLRVVLKQKFLDGRGNDGDGRRWYAREAICAINQTLGRVIRHRKDFGAVLLCDSRYAVEGRLAPLSAGLSAWLRPRVSVLQSFKGALDGCRDFFGLAAAQPAKLAAVTAEGIASSDGHAPSAPSVPAAASLPAPAQRQPSLSGLANAAGPFKRQAAVASSGTSLSTLGALWKRGRAAPRTAPAEAPQPQLAEAAAGRPPAVFAGSSSASSAPAPPAAGVPAAPSQMTSGGALPQSLPPAAAACAAAAAADGLPSRPVARPAAQRRAQQSPEAARWLQCAEALLPRMDYERLEVHIRNMQEHASTVASARPGDASADASAERLTSALAAVSEAVLPEFCFDTPDEERARNGLVRDLTRLLPRLLWPLWRQRVDGLLKRRGGAKFAW